MLCASVPFHNNKPGGVKVPADRALIALLCLPATLIGAWIGARVYVGVSAQTFQCVVLGLLLVSGCILIGQALVF
jgi:uncharacterized protein